MGVRAAKEIIDMGGDAYFVKTDVSQEEQVKNLVDRAILKYGRVDSPSTTQAWKVKGQISKRNDGNVERNHGN
jgi:hypothetical protein